MPRDPKPHIRVPDDNGPNPYDSKTGFQPKPWLTLKFWVWAICAGLALYFTRQFLGH